MDFQTLVDSSMVPCAVLSVEKTPEGACGTIRILRANDSCRKIMSSCGLEFHNDMAYDELVPRDLKFEDSCLRAAFCNRRLHAYVQSEAFGTWADQVLVPLRPASDVLGFCQLFFEPTKDMEPDRMACVPMDTTAEVIRACNTLLGQRDFVDKVGRVLEDVLEVSGALSCRILLVDRAKEEVTTYCERIAEARGAWYLGSHVVPYGFVCQWDGIIGPENVIVVKDKRDMERIETRCSEWVETMRRHGISSIVLAPLRRGDKSFGYLYITDFSVERVAKIAELVELMAFFLASEISNNLLAGRLEEMGSTDLLTGLQNRNSMIRRIGQLASNETRTPFGVINLDLNGLKVTNDSFGHHAGDKLLIEAAEMLRKVFYEEDLFRTGGDEFIVLSFNIDRETFERKLHRLQSVAQKDGAVSFAMGSCWSDGSMDVRVAFLEADEDMYENKRAYYQQHPSIRPA